MPVVAILDDFAHVSGLRTNRSKSCLIWTLAAQHYLLATVASLCSLQVTLAGLLVFWWDYRMQWSITRISAHGLSEADLY